MVGIDYREIDKYVASFYCKVKERAATILEMDEMILPNHAR